MERMGNLVSHPSSDPVTANLSSKAQSRRAHGEIRDQVPEQGDDLDDSGNERQERGLELEDVHHADATVSLRFGAKCQAQAQTADDD